MTEGTDTQKIEEFLIQLEINLEQARKTPNIWAIAQGTVDVYIIVAGGFLIIQSKIMDIPKSNLLTFYRKLLELNDNAEESLGASFGINKNSEVILKILRPTSHLNFEEFSYYLTSVTYVADKFATYLRQKFS